MYFSCSSLTSSVQMSQMQKEPSLLPVIRVSLVWVIFMKLIKSPWIFHSRHWPGRLKGKSKSWVAPVEDPETRIFPSPETQMEDRSKLWRSISWTILDWDICFTLLNTNQNYFNLSMKKNHNHIHWILDNERKNKNFNTKDKNHVNRFATW